MILTPWGVFFVTSHTGIVFILKRTIHEGLLRVHSNIPIHRYARCMCK